MDTAAVTSTVLTALNVFWMVLLVVFGTLTTYISLHMLYMEMKQKLTRSRKATAYDPLYFPTVQDA